MKRHAPRDSTKGLKSRALSIAVDPVTRAKLEIAARLKNQSVADYVVASAVQRLEADEVVAALQLESGEPLTIHELGKRISSKTASRQFVRMAFAMPSLLSINELVLYRVILETAELWYRDPHKHPPLMHDLSEPKIPVFNYELLEQQWPALKALAKDKEKDGRYHMGAFLQHYFPNSVQVKKES